MTKRWLNEHHRDPYYRKAKKEGYRARSAYKLLEINRRYRIIRPHDSVVDLGCAPGGWLQVIRSLTDREVVGIDIMPMEPIERVKFIRGDITDERTMEKLRKAAGGGVNTVVSDMAPNISGNYSLDQARSAHLAEMALKAAEELLVPGGNFLVKVFEGDMFPSFISRVRVAFRMVKVHNPPASRKSSSEVYVIAKNFIGERGTNEAEGMERETEAN